MDVFVKTSQGIRRHGKIDEDNNFIRMIPRHHVRWSDRSFCINVDAISKIKSTENCIFYYQKSNITEIMAMRTLDVLSYRPTYNEFGERNIRIPIDDCELIATLKKKVRKPASPTKRKAEKREEEGGFPKLF